jgi:small subunit ribosomal protein S6
VIRINAYEIMLMIEPEVAEERHAEIIERTKATITERGGVWGSVDEWGKRKLAYEINHMADAWYYVLTFESEPEALHEATRVLAITDGVMRHMAVARTQRASGSAAAAEPEPAEASA